MTDADKVTLECIESLLVSERISVAKALEGAFLIGELSGKLEMARIKDGQLKEVMAEWVFDPALDIIGGKVKP